MSPCVLSLVFDTTPAPPRHRRWRWWTQLATADDPPAGGEPDRFGFADLRGHLFDGVGKVISFADLLGGSYLATLEVRGLGLKPQPLGLNRVASLSGIYEVTVEEVTDVTEADPAGVWDESAWDTDAAWG